MRQQVVLAFDTCGASGSVALVALPCESAAVACLLQVELAGRSAAAQLMPAIGSMLQKAELDLGSLRALLVVSGPGSFTGERVGLSTAKGLAHATGLGIIAISRLAVLASLAPGEERLALLDAGRNEFYARRGEDEWLASFAEIAAAADAGEGLLVAEDSVAERFAAWKPRRLGPLDAFAAARAALPRLRAGQFDDLATLDANYLRRSDAELFARVGSVPAE